MVALKMQEPLRVPGMERYMATKARAKQLAEEQRQREEKAFVLNPRDKLETCTIPQPFSLRTDMREVNEVPKLPCLRSNGPLTYVSAW